jgi:RNA polymerase sigma-70 factor (ECF subfamily)
MDLVQECAARAISARRVPTDEAAYRAWLFRIIRNLFFDAQRRRHHAPLLLDDVLPHSGDIATWDCERAYISRITVQTGLRKMSIDHRDIIALVDIVGLSYAEAASLLGVPKGTVMSRLNRARQILMCYIAKENVHPFPTAKAENR